MRTVTSTVESAITDAVSSKIAIQAIIDPSRTFFENVTSDYPYDAGDYSVPTDTPTGQAVLYDHNTEDLYTFVVDPSTGVIYGMIKGSATKNNLGLTADANTKPAVESLGNGSAYLYYWDGSNLKRSTINLSTWGASGTTTITINYVPAAWTITGGSPHVLSNGELAFFYQTSRGGIGVAYYDNAIWHHWKGRFISPNQKTSLDWTIYTAAAAKDGSIFFYMTDMDTGEVKGTEYKPTRKIWTDSFIALPADLSRFNIGNAIQANGYIHLSGQFHRTEDLADADVYSLVLRSTDGRAFSWDRFTMLSTEGFAFNIALDNTNKILWASDRNSVGYSNTSYFFHQIPVDRLTLLPPYDVVSFQLSNNSNATLGVKAGDEAYMNTDVVRKGSRVTIYIGYEVGGVFEYSKYAQFIIDTTSKDFKNGERSFTLNLTDEGLWKTNELVFPFYAEILSKVTSHDDCDERDKMYAVQTKRPEAPDYLYVDLWGNNYWDGDGSVSGTAFRMRGGGIGCERTTTTNYQGATDQLLMKTIDLNEHPLLTGYPTIEGTTLTMSLYGWEMVTTAGRPNSNWVLYAVTAPSDDLEDKTVTTGSLSSSYAKFPQEYYSTEAGSSPVVYGFSGLTADNVLLYVGIAIQNTDASGGSSTLDPSRIEIEGLSFLYTTDTSSRGWDLSVPSGLAREYLEMPATGIPSVMFLSKPYTSFNFNISAQFVYEAGDDPLLNGTVGWGVVGLAKDGLDMIIARYSKLNSAIQLVSLRNGVETILASYTPSSQPEDIMLDHRDGLFKVLVRETGTTWTGPVISYYWDEVTYDEISTSDTGIMHVGIYGAAVPPSFITPSFSVLNGQGIAVSTHQDPATALTGFPSSGKVLIDGILYSYLSKITSSTFYGPYQGRQSAQYTSYNEDSTTFSGWATEIALYHPNNSYNTVAGLLFSSDNGYCWEIINTDWTVTHYTAGVPNYLRNRSRHYCVDHGGDVIGTSNRVYIGPGLSGIDQEDDNPSYLHSHGSLVSLYGTDKIWCKKVVGTTCDPDSSVQDMLKYVCELASVGTEFGGDWTAASQSVGTTPVELASTEELLPGGFDVSFSIGALASSAYAEVYASNLYYNTTETIHIGVTNSGGLLSVYADPDGSSATETIQTGISANATHTIRVVFHTEFGSIYIDGKWVGTFAFGEDNLTWPTTQVALYAKASSTITFSDIKVVELFDWREAIYMESEITASSAIGSVVQERPVEILTTQDGNLDFSYNLSRDSISYTTAISARILHSHNERKATSQDAGSDAIVYYKDIAFASDPVFAAEDGFITRVLRLSSLDTGAEVAGRLILKRARQRQIIHTVEIRPDIRLMLADDLALAYTTAQGNTTNVAMIVESLSIFLREGEYTMSVSGRDNS